jgi:hypothetical protein
VFCSETLALNNYQTGYFSEKIIKNVKLTQKRHILARENVYKLSSPN